MEFFDRKRVERNTNQTAHPGYEPEVSPLPNVPYVKRFETAEQARELLAKPDVQMVYKEIDTSPFVSHLLRFAYKNRGAVVPVHGRSLVTERDAFAERLANDLHSSPEFDQVSRDKFISQLVECSELFSKILSDGHFNFDLSVRDRKWMNDIDNLSEKDNESLHYDFQPIFGLWTPIGNQTVMPLEEDVDRNKFYELRERTPHMWSNALEHGSLFGVPPGSFIVAKGARLRHKSTLPTGEVREWIDPDLCKTGAIYDCGKPWLHLVRPIESGDVKVLARFWTQSVPSFFNTNPEISG